MKTYTLIKLRKKISEAKDKYEAACKKLIGKEVLITKGSTGGFWAVVLAANYGSITIRNLKSGKEYHIDPYHVAVTEDDDSH